MNPVERLEIVEVVWFGRSTYLRFFIILFPKTPVFALAWHVKNREIYFMLGKCFHFKPNCRSDVYLSILQKVRNRNNEMKIWEFRPDTHLFWFQPINHSRFSWVVKTDYDDLGLLLAKGTAHYLNNYNRVSCFLLLLK